MKADNDTESEVKRGRLQLGNNHFKIWGRIARHVHGYLCIKYQEKGRRRLCVVLEEPELFASIGHAGEGRRKVTICSVTSTERPALGV